MIPAIPEREPARHSSAGRYRGITRRIVGAWWAALAGSAVAAGGAAAHQRDVAVLGVLIWTLAVAMQYRLALARRETKGEP